MKKTILKLTLSLFSIAILFSSCLGDNTSSMERTRDFTIIKSEGTFGAKYAATPTGYGITSPEIDKLTVGNAYYLSYKITELTPNSAGLYNAEVKEQIFINKAYLNYNTSLPAPSAPKDSVYANSFGIGAFSGDDYYSDRWLFGYSTSIKEGETVKATLYYDRDKQQEKDTQIIMEGSERENKLIIDVHFTKENPNLTGETTTVSANEVFADFSGIRESFTPNPLIKEDLTQFNGKEYVKVKIKFRYWRISGTKKEQIYLGTWNINESSTSGYVMYLEKR